LNPWNPANSQNVAERTKEFPHSDRLWHSWSGENYFTIFGKFLIFSRSNDISNGVNDKIDLSDELPYIKM